MGDSSEIKLEVYMERKRDYQWQDVGMKLKRSREAVGLSQEQVAERLGVTGHMVWFWEAGRSMPRADRLSGLAILFGVTVDWLLGQERADGDEDALMEEAELALRSASDQLTPEDVKSIRDYIRFVHERRRREALEADDES